MFNSPADARSELIACGTTLFQFASYRLSQQLNEFDDCQQLNAGLEDRDCSGSIQRTIVDMQQQLLDYIRCTRDIP
uniref:Uncharacterized protein n=1 Tax=Anopheles farauti TaxID=69004 RepID=A0A182QM86_9DIPT